MIINDVTSAPDLRRRILDLASEVGVRNSGIRLLQLFVQIRQRFFEQLAMLGILGSFQLLQNSLTREP